MLKFKRNMGSLDRTARLIVGTALLITGPITNLVELSTVLEVILGMLGATAILSTLFSYCFLYAFTGSNTAR